MNSIKYNRIVQDTERCRGRPIIKGTRLEAHWMVEMFHGEITERMINGTIKDRKVTSFDIVDAIDDILKEYDWITREDLLEAIEYNKKYPHNTEGLK